MAWESRVISGTPQSWLEVDYTESTPVDPGNQRWTKDPQDPEYWFDSSHWRFPGQVSTAIVFYGFTWSPNAIEAAAVPQSFRVKFDKFMLGGAFTFNDVVDGGIIPTYPSQAGGATPKPDDKDYASNRRWPKGVIQPSVYSILQNVAESNRLTNAQLMEPGFGFLVYLKTVTGKFEAVNGSGMGIINPKMEIEYLIEVP